VKNMLYRKMPKNGDELSILGFGCMRLPLKEDGSIDEERSTKLIRYAIDHGVNYVDTAWPYHDEQNEPILGRALANGYRNKVKLATKIPIWLINSRADMDRLLNTQLEKLKTNYIDYYLLHNVSGVMWNHLVKLDVVDFFNKAKEDGRIVNAGFSFHSSLEDFKSIIDSYNWDFCQIQYNFLNEQNQAGTVGLEYAASKGLGVIIMEPLSGGRLVNYIPPAVKEIWDKAPVQRTAAAWGLRWVWNHPEVTVVLSGMNEESQVEENLKIANEAYPNSLTETELQLVKKVEQKYRESMKVGCTGCRYCMPCKQGVNIPTCFEYYDNFYISKNLKGAKFRYTIQLSGIPGILKPGFASQCIQCGECLEKCPQKLEIPTLLKAVVKEFEGPEL
jgi:uncharacterized protein